MHPTTALTSRRPLFAPGIARRMWSRLWPAFAFYALATPAGAFRGIADNLGVPARREFNAVEDMLLTAAPTHLLQGSFIDTHAVQLAATTVYITWFLVPITTAFGVLLFRPRDYWRFIAFLLLVYYAVMPFFAIYPLEAPWAHDAGIRRYVAELFPEAAGADPNPYAAMPSLHVGLIAAAVFWYGIRGWIGKVVLAYSLLVSVVVVYGGDHYLADVVGGYAVAGAAYACAKWLRLPVFATEASPIAARMPAAPVVEPAAAPGRGLPAFARPARYVRASLAALGSRLVLLAVTLLALGWFISGPLNVMRYANEHPFRVDYLAYDTAATIVRHGNADKLYEPDFQHDTQELRTGSDEQSYTVYLNPPIVGALFVPLSFTEPRTGYVLSVVLLATTMVIATAILFRLLEGLPDRMRWIASICIFGSTATASALMSGQLTPVLLLIGAASVLAYRRGHIEASGVVLGLLAIKPHFALAVLLMLLIARQRKLAAYMTAMGAACALASLAIVGVSGAQSYVEIMQRSYADPTSLYIDIRSEQNVSGLIALVFGVYGGPAITLPGIAIALIVLAATARALSRSPYRGAEQVQYVAALIAVFVCSTAPHIQFYDLALLAFPAIFILRRAATYEPRVRARFYGVLVLMVIWIEFAGILAGAKLSVSIVPLFIFTMMICAWPRFEAWLAGAQRLADENATTPPARGDIEDLAAA